MTLCECGCGKTVIIGNRFIHGHNFKGVKGKKHPQYGKHCSEITIKKMHDARIGKHFSNETKEKIRQIVIDEWKNNSERRNNIPRGKYSKNFGKKASQETKVKLSKIFSGINNPMYGKTPKHTKRFYYDSPLQGKICLRSSYELAYAKYLDSQHILWMYEIETFDLGNMTYTPDFFLPQFEKFIEIKGYMNEISQNKINMFLEQYPWDLEVLRKENLLKLGIEL